MSGGSRINAGSRNRAGYGIPPCDRLGWRSRLQEAERQSETKQQDGPQPDRIPDAMRQTASISATNFKNPASHSIPPLVR